MSVLGLYMNIHIHVNMHIHMHTYMKDKNEGSLRNDFEVPLTSACM